jgi:hypothetical protein
MSFNNFEYASELKKGIDYNKFSGYGKKGGRPQHARKNEFKEIAQATWSSLPKIAVSRMANAIIKYDEKYYSDTPKIDAMKGYISECANKPTFKKGDKGINTFELTIK